MRRRRWKEIKKKVSAKTWTRLFGKPVRNVKSCEIQSHFFTLVSLVGKFRLLAHAGDFYKTKVARQARI